MANKKMLAAAFAVVMSGGITALPMHAAAAQGVTDQASSSAEIRNQYIVTLAPNIVERLGVTDLRVQYKRCFLLSVARRSYTPMNMR